MAVDRFDVDISDLSFLFVRVEVVQFVIYEENDGFTWVAIADVEPELPLHFRKQIPLFSSWGYRLVGKYEVPSTTPSSWKERIAAQIPLRAETDYFVALKGSTVSIQRKAGYVLFLSVSFCL